MELTLGRWFTSFKWCSNAAAYWANATHGPVDTAAAAALERAEHGASGVCDGDDDALSRPICAHVCVHTHVCVCVCARVAVAVEHGRNSDLLH